jgi:glycosyltransferase involved in cell wall biosynthesis
MLASTVPADDDDAVPRFVLDQALAMCEVDPSLEVRILAPHTSRSHGMEWPRAEADHGRVVQERFRYGPGRTEVLTIRGIMPAITERPVRILLVPLMMIAQVWRTWRVVRRERPDVIYAHWFTTQALSARLVSTLTKTPYGFTTHASDVAVWKRFGPVGRMVVHWGVRKASFMTAVSQQTADKLLAFFSGETRERMRAGLVILPMGTHIPLEPVAPGDPDHVYIVARLVEKKGVQHLLAAWPEVVSRVPGARLTIAGSGPWEDQLRALATSLSLDVDFPGYVVGERKAAIVASAGVCVQPSIVARDGDSDGLPVAALEGLAAGRVVVASDASGAQDILTDGVDGFLVPAGDEDALADALISALTMSAKERAAMTKKACVVARQVAWPHVARQHLALIAACQNGPCEDSAR